MSPPWEKYAARQNGPWTKYAPPTVQSPDVDQGMRQAFGSGLTFGFGDELAAGLRAAVGPAIQKGMEYVGNLDKKLGLEGVGGGAEDFQRSPMGTASTAPDIGTRYSEELDKERAKGKAFAQEHPALSTASNVAGNLLGSAALLSAGPAGLIARGPSLGLNVARTAGVGGALAGAQGFGEGEGGFAKRVGHAVGPALVGAGVGAALPIAGAVGQRLMETAPGRYISEKVVSPLARTLSGVPPQSVSAAAPDGSPGVTGGPVQEFAQRTGNVAQTGAINRLALAAQRSGMTARQAAARRAELGDEAMIADIGPQFLSEARKARTLPGETRTLAKTVLESRDRGTGPRIVKSFEGSEPPPSAYALRGEKQAFDQNIRAVGQRAYGAMDEAGLKQTPELRALYENPEVSSAIDRVLSADRAARVGRPDAQPASGIEVMHMVKREIQDLGYDKMTGKPMSTAQKWRDLADDFVSQLKKANPALAEADAAYAQAKSLPEFFDIGASTLKREGVSEQAIERSAPALAEALAKANPQQALAARSGATNAVRAQAEESTNLARALARRIDESGPLRSKLEQLYGRERAAEIMRRAAAEKQFAETSNELLKGSQTADKLSEALDTNAHLRITPQGVTPRLFQHLSDAYDAVVNPNEAVRDAIGRATLNPNSAESDRLLRLIYSEIERRGRGSPLAASIAGSSGSLVSP